METRIRIVSVRVWVLVSAGVVEAWYHAADVLAKQQSSSWCGRWDIYRENSRRTVIEPDFLRGGPVVGTYHVWNPHGIVIEEGASVAQVCFVDGRSFAAETVSELLVPAQIRTFRSAGVIGQSRTTLPETDDLRPVDGSWRLEKNQPCIVEFEPSVTLADDELLTPTRHTADEAGNHVLGFFNQYSRLGDPGYHGKLGMLVVPITDTNLSVDQGVARVAKHRVVRIGELGAYDGQWQGSVADGERVMEFRSIYDWSELIGVQMPDLETLLQD